MDNRILDQDFSFDASNLPDETVKNINLTKLEVNHASENILKDRNVFFLLVILAGAGTVVEIVNNPYGVSKTEVFIEADILISIYLLILSNSTT